jgi:hypothetical protein
MAFAMRSTPISESAEERQFRIVREAEHLREARTSLDSGKFLSSAEVKAWIDGLSMDDDVPHGKATVKRR